MIDIQDWITGTELGGTISRNNVDNAYGTFLNVFKKLYDQKLSNTKNIQES